MSRFAGRVVIVTGSSSGIGQAALLAFAKEGASVTLHGTNSERLKATEELLAAAGIPESRILVVQGTLEDEAVHQKIINDTVEKFGQIDVLVNNAGVFQKPGVDPTSLENLDFVYSINVRAPFNLINLALPHLVKTKGNIVNVSSIAAFKPSVNGPPATVYSASKAAIDAITKTKAPRFAKQGVRINSLNPGPFETNIFQRNDQQTPEEQAAQDKILSDWKKNVIPLERFGNVNELTPVILLLADPANSYTTGATWVVDGGSLVSSAVLI